MRYHIEFGRSRSNRVGMSRGEPPELGSAGDTLLGWGVAELQEIRPSPRVTGAEFVRFRSHGTSLKNLTHCFPPFKVTQGRSSEPTIYRSATYDFLYINVLYRPISYRFRDNQRFQSQVANFPHPY